MLPFNLYMTGVYVLPVADTAPDIKRRPQCTYQTYIYIIYNV